MHALFVYGVKALPPDKPPLVNAQAVAPVAVLVKPIDWPALRDCEAVAAGSIVIEGNGVIARFEPWGHELMNVAASVKTERTPSGVSNGEGIAWARLAVRMNVW